MVNRKVFTLVLLMFAALEGAKGIVKPWAFRHAAEDTGVKRDVFAAVGTVL